MDDKLKFRIEEFKERIKVEKDFCEELYRYATIRLMAHKYAYYICSNSYIEDIAYDLEEKSWHIMGIALGYLKEDDTSPCVDFNDKHPLATEGMLLAEKLMRK